VREVDVDGLLEATADPMVHHHLDLRHLRRAWVGDGAVVVQHGVSWADAPADALALLCLGPPGALDDLVARVARVVPEPWRVVAETGSETALPPGWRPAEPRRWHWMTTRRAPEPVSGEDAVVEVTAAEAVAVLDSTPRAFPPPAPEAVDCWLGVRGENGEASAVGALLRLSRDGTGHLRAIATRPSHRGRGLGATVSAALTRRALAEGSGLATLGVFTDNDVAVRLYERLGYAVVHTFVAGTTAP
jgi:GNAT superfamily N-acetyltransferase